MQLLDPAMPDSKLAVFCLLHIRSRVYCAPQIEAGCAGFEKHLHSCTMLYDGLRSYMQCCDTGRASPDYAFEYVGIRIRISSFHSTHSCHNNCRLSGLTTYIKSSCEVASMPCVYIHDICMVNVYLNIPVHYVCRNVWAWATSIDTHSFCCHISELADLIYFALYSNGFSLSFAVLFASLDHLDTNAHCKQYLPTAKHNL